MTKITPDISIEDLVTAFPASVPFLLQKGIQCIVCGEPIWGTLGDAIQAKGIANDEAVAIINELNHWVNSEDRK